MMSIVNFCRLKYFLQYRFYLVTRNFSACSTIFIHVVKKLNNPGSKTYIPNYQEAEIRRIVLQSQPEEIIPKNTQHTTGLAQSGSSGRAPA
jgi:hypothetical protein